MKRGFTLGRFYLLLLPLLVLAGGFFGTTGEVNAEEPEACGFGLLACDESGVVWDSAVSNQVAQLGGSDGLEELLSMLSTFANGPIMVLLFSLALLFFLFNIARFFIFTSGSTAKKEEAKRSAIYGILAFVFLISIWGIVNLFVRGLDIDRSEAVCPDYFKLFGGELFCGPGLGGTGGGKDGGGKDGGGKDGGGKDGGGGSAVGGSSTGESELTRLLYGDFEDISVFNFWNGPPRAKNNVVAVPQNATCNAGLTTLQSAAAIESSQASYLMYKNSGGATQFVNLTDVTSPTRVDIDADTFYNYDENESPIIIHTHQQQQVDLLGLPMQGQAPSVADMEIGCDSVANGATYMVVDSSYIWSFARTADSCPLSDIERSNLPIISALLQLSLLGSEVRANEYELLLAANDIPSNLRSGLNNYSSIDFASLTKFEVVTLADDLARQGDMQIKRQSVEGFCESY